MNPQERQLVDELFERLAKLESAPRDADAAAVINQGLSRAPNAIYPLVQTVLLQEEALKRAAARIEELEARAGAQQEQQGGFLDSMRGAIFGQQQKGGSVPSVRQAEPDRPVWNTGGAYQAAPAPAGQPMPQADPRAQGGGFGGGGSFLGTAAAAAVGMIGGSMLMNSIGGMMGGGHRQGFGDALVDGQRRRQPMERRSVEGRSRPRGRRQRHRPRWRRTRCGCRRPAGLRRSGLERGS